MRCMCTGNGNAKHDGVCFVCLGRYDVKERSCVLYALDFVRPRVMLR